MPGFTLAQGSIQVATDLQAPYTNRIFFKSNGLSLSANAYDGYPVQFKTVKNTSIYFEGYIYNNDWESITATLLECIESGNHERIKSTIAKCDGEFVFVFTLKEQKKALVINDSWGRLPIYHYESADKFIVSREIKAVKRAAAPLIFSNVDVAIQLMFGYTFGSSTIWKSIQRLQPHSLLEISLETGTSKMRNGFQMPSSGNLDIDEVIPDIHNQFATALKNRVSQLKNPSLSLSAGLDSRLIAGYLEKEQILLPLTTFDYPKLNRDDDVMGAKSIAKALQMRDRHSVKELSEPGNEQFEKLIGLKEGMQDLSMAFILEYYEWLASKGYTTLTGDGGDKFFVDLRPLRKIKSLADLASYIIRYHAKLSIKEAAGLSGATNSEIEGHIENRLKSYPVSTFEEKHAYFTIRERGINWLFEGEDRNRSYCWSSSPYYAPNLIKASMAISMAKKQMGKFFIALFSTLPGNLGDVKNPNWKLAPSNAHGVKKLLAKQALKQKLPEWLLPKQAIGSTDFDHAALLMATWKNNAQLLPLKAGNPKYHSEVLWRMLTLAMS